MLRGLPEELRTPGHPQSARLEMPREEDAPFLPRRAPRRRASLGQQSIGPHGFRASQAFLSFSGAQSQARRQWAQTEAHEVPAKCEKMILYCEADSSGTGCQGGCGISSGDAQDPLATTLRSVLWVTLLGRGCPGGSPEAPSHLHHSGALQVLLPCSAEPRLWAALQKPWAAPAQMETRSSAGLVTAGGTALPSLTRTTDARSQGL